MASKINVDKIARGSGTPEFTIPTADGSANEFLKTDGSGVLSFGAVTSTTINNNANNRIISGSATANTLEGETNLTYDGNTLDIKNAGTASSINLYCESSNAHYTKIKSGPHSGATAYTLTLPNKPPTTNGQALTATTAGVASWATAGGSLVKLLSTTISGAVAAIAFNSTYVTTTYSKYMLMWEGVVPSTDAHSLAIGLSVDNGSSFPTHVGQFVYHQINAGSVFGTNGNLAYYPANTDITNTGSHGGASGYAYIYNTLSTSQNKYITGMGAQTNNTTANSYGFTSFGKVFTTSAINYMKLYEPEAGGNFSAGTATLYGIET